MPMSKQRLAGLLAEKDKQQNLPSLKNPLAKTMPMAQVNPINAPSVMPPVVPQVSFPKKFSNKSAVPMVSPSGSFGGLKQKLRKF